MTVWFLHVKAHKATNNHWYWASKPAFYLLFRQPTSHWLALFNLWVSDAPVTLVIVKCDNLHYLAARVSKETDPKSTNKCMENTDAWKTSQRVQNQLDELDECIKRNERWLWTQKHQRERSLTSLHGRRWAADAADAFRMKTKHIHAVWSSTKRLRWRTMVFLVRSIACRME